MHHLRLLHKLGQLAALMFFPFWLLVGIHFARDSLNALKLRVFLLGQIFFKERAALGFDKAKRS